MRIEARRWKVKRPAKKTDHGTGLALLVALVILVGSTGGPLSSTAPDDSVELTTRQSMLLDHLQELDHELYVRILRLELSGVVDDEGLERDAKQLHRRLSSLEAGFASGLTPADAVLRRKIESLQTLADHVERVAAGGQIDSLGLASRRQVKARGARPARLDGANRVQNDSCLAALPFREGRALGSTWLGTPSELGPFPAPGSADVWYHYQSDRSGWLTIDTIGSDFDTVLSLHAACGEEPLEENDDSVGLQAAVSTAVEPGTEFWIRVAGYQGATGTFALNGSAGGTISGIVRDAITLEPVPGVNVRAYTPTLSYVRSAYTDSSGSYTLGPLADGGYLIVTSYVGSYLNELFDDVSCPNITSAGCATEAGTVVEILNQDSVQGVDFDLDMGGQISGQVTHHVSGDPLYGVQIKVWDEMGSNVHTTYTATDGTYTAVGLYPASYYVTASHSLFRDELYDDLPCQIDYSAHCDFSVGTPVAVAVNTVTSGIDFSLDELGIVAGQVTRESNGTPVQFASVQVFGVSGRVVGSDSVDENGNYEIGGLSPGTYFVTASH